MRAIVFVVFVLSAGLVSAQDDAKKELDKLKGTYSVVSIDDPMAGKAPDDLVKSMKITIAGDKLTMKAGERTIEVTFKIDPTQKPAAIDIVRKRNDKEEIAKGIYSLEGDTLKICASDPGLERPKEFKTDAATKAGIMTLKKDKE